MFRNSYFQGLSGKAGRVQHDLLLITARPICGGADCKFFIDSTYRQVQPFIDLPTSLKFYPMGPGVDPPYLAHGTQGNVFRDDEPFSLYKMDVVLASIYPRFDLPDVIVHTPGFRSQADAQMCAIVQAVTSVIGQ